MNIKNAIKTLKILIRQLRYPVIEFKPPKGFETNYRIYVVDKGDKNFPYNVTIFNYKGNVINILGRKCENQIYHFHNRKNVFEFIQGEKRLFNEGIRIGLHDNELKELY